jgi:hypothetical protein
MAEIQLQKIATLIDLHTIEYPHLSQLQNPLRCGAASLFWVAAQPKR